MIIVNGAQFRTLNDEITVDGNKVYQVWCNGAMVYPEGGRLVFFVDTSGSMTAEQAVSGVNTAYSSTTAHIMSAVAFGGHSGTIIGETVDLEEVIYAVRSEEYSGSGNDAEPFDQLYALISSLGPGSFVAAIGDDEFTLTSDETDRLNAVCYTNGVTWSFFLV